MNETSWGIASVEQNLGKEFKYSMKVVRGFLKPKTVGGKFT